MRARRDDFPEAVDPGELAHIAADEVIERFDSELLASIPHAPATLPPASQLVLRMHYLEELTCVEIAEALEISVGTVRSRLAYGLAAMRWMMTKLD